MPKGPRPTTAGNPATQLSLRAEHSGTLAILYFLQALCTYYKIMYSESRINLWIDNMEVISRTNSPIQNQQHIKFNTLDHDLWAESQQVIDGLPCVVTSHHVKSHQYDSKELEDLSTEAYWNVMMDRKAECHREHNLYNLPATFLTTSAISLRINNILIVGPVNKTLMGKCPDLI